MSSELYIRELRASYVRAAANGGADAFYLLSAARQYDFAVGRIADYRSSTYHRPAF